jgi:hypothetical protein
MMTQEERNEKISEQMAADKSKSGLVEKLVFIILPICVSAIGWLLTQVSDLQNEVTVLNNKVAVVVNAENKAIPPQGTTIELEQLRATAMQARADMKMEITDRLTTTQIAAMQERADLKARISVLESKIKH